MRRYISAGVGLTGIALLVQAGAMVRTLQLSSQHGASANLDAFYLANAITVGLFNIVGSAVSLVLVPAFVHGRSRVELRTYIRWVYALSGLLGIVLIGASFVFRWEVFGPEVLGVELVAILLLGQFFRISTAIDTATMNASERFMWPRVLTLVPAFLPVLMLLWQPNLGLLSAGLVGAYLLEAVGNRVAASRMDRKSAASAGGGHRAGVQEEPGLLAETWPIVGSSGLFQLQAIGLMVLVSRFGEGVVTAYSNAYQLVGFVQAILIQNLLLLVYPRMAALVREGVLWSESRLSAILSLSVAVTFGVILSYFAVGQDVVILLFARGEYSVEQAQTVYLFGALLLLALPFGTVREVLYRLLYASGNSKLAATNSVIVIGVTVVLLLAFVGPMGVTGIFVALGVAALVSAVRAYFLLGRLGLRCDHRAFWISALTYLASLLVALAGLYWSTLLLTGVLRLLAGLAVAVGIFALLALGRARKDLSAIRG